MRLGRRLCLPGMKNPFHIKAVQIVEQGERPFIINGAELKLSIFINTL